MEPEKFPILPDDHDSTGDTGVQTVDIDEPKTTPEAKSDSAEALSNKIGAELSKAATFFVEKNKMSPDEAVEWIEETLKLVDQHGKAFLREWARNYMQELAAKTTEATSQKVREGTSKEMATIT